jgi:hypothetical protein
MENVISRHCIHPDTVLYEHNEVTGELIKIYNRDEFFQLINQWKVYLVENYNVQPGETIAMELAPGLMYYSLVFAAAELGLVFILDWPICYTEKDLERPKVKMWGKIDYIVSHTTHEDSCHIKGQQSWSKWTHQRNLIYGKTFIYEDKMFEYDMNQSKQITTIINDIRATPDSPLIQFSSSGTTRLPKPIMNTHHKVYVMSRRITALNFTYGLRLLNFNNLHHGASMSYHFMPGFMVGSTIFTGAGCYGPTEFGIEQVVNFALANQINQLFLYRQDYSEYFLRTIPRVDYTVNITTLLQITPEMVQLVKDKNVNYICSPFGDTTIGQAIFNKKVTQATDLATYDVTNQGVVPDDFYEVEVRDGALWIAIPSLNQEWRTSGDAYEQINGEFYFRGRANQYRINNVWIVLGDIEQEVTRLFGPKDANIVIDFDMQKIYLAVWEENQEAEAALNQYFDKTYHKKVYVSYVLRDEPYEHFFNSRKMDNSKIREVCREKIKQGN